MKGKTKARGPVATPHGEKVFGPRTHQNLHGDIVKIDGQYYLMAVFKPSSFVMVQRIFGYLPISL